MGSGTLLLSTGVWLLSHTCALYAAPRDVRIVRFRWAQKDDNNNLIVLFLYFCIV